MHALYADSPELIRGNKLNERKVEDEGATASTTQKPKLLFDGKQLKLVPNCQVVERIMCSINFKRNIYCGFSSFSCTYVSYMYE